MLLSLPVSWLLAARPMVYEDSGYQHQIPQYPESPSQKIPVHLVNRYRMRYSRAAAAKSAAGFRSPENLKATWHAAIRRFCVAAFVHLLKMQL